MMKKLQTETRKIELTEEELEAVQGGLIPNIGSTRGDVRDREPQGLIPDIGSSRGD